MTLSDYLYYDDKMSGIQIYYGDCFKVMALMAPKSVDLVVTSPPFLDKEVAGDYYSFLENFIRGVMVVGKWVFMFNSATRLIDICRKTDPRFVMVWNKVFTMSAYRYEPIFVYTDTEESIWGRGKIFNTCFSYKVKMKEKKHINENPVELYRNLIKLKRNAMVVLDPFMGSGTTLLACKELQKKAIGIDISEKYCKIARKRLEDMSCGLLMNSKELL